MNDINLFEGFEPKENQKSEPEPDMCKCSECGKTMKVSDCHTDFDHHDGWEMPAYTEIDCVFCEGGGCVDDFFFSKENSPNER